MTRLLSICTSFRRPTMLMDMLKSWKATRSEGSEMMIYLHEDDPLLEEYGRLIQEYIEENGEDWAFIIGPHRQLAEVLNYISFEVFPNFKYFQIICDDHIYRTNGWDLKLIEAFEKKSNGWGFACGRDLINNDKWDLCEHPSAEIWSAKQAKLLGYAYPRNMKHLHLDYYTKTLGKAVGGLVFVPEVIIEHLWYGGCDKPMDQNIKDKYNTEQIAMADAAFAEWKSKEMQTAIDKIKKVQEWEGENAQGQTKT